MRELTKSFPNLWIRVTDSDGEFLLIEAAKVTPKWLSPENDTNRVWIHDGKLRIIPLKDSISKPLSLREAIETIQTSPARLIHSTFIEAEAFYRLEKYPAQIADSFHHALATVPRKLAYILHARPKAIAPATEAFYLRDPRSLKPLLSASPALTFPPADLVTVSVRFTKVLYAQLKSQHFPAPPAWRSLLDSAETEATTAPDSAEAQKTLSRVELGMKLTTGFELLSRTADFSSNRLVREVALLLEDLEEDGGDAALPSDDEISKWKDVEREDDDAWMNIDYADFERELDGKGMGTGAGMKVGRESKGGEGGKFGDAAAQADLQKIVERFEAFLNDDKAGLEGAEVEVDEMDRDDDESDEEDWEEESSDEDEDKEVGFDEEQFARMMREMMGLPSEGDGGQRDKGKQKAELDELEDRDEDEDEEIRKLMEQMESELKGHGALDLDPKPKTISAIKEKGKSKAAVEVKDDEESGDEVDIDYNLAKNLLESFKSQAGMAGPAGNLLGLMGVTLPRDEQDSDDDKK